MNNKVPTYFLITIIGTALLGTALLGTAYSSSIFVFEKTPTLEKSLGTITFAPIVIVNGTEVYILYNEGSGLQDILRLEKSLTCC